MPKLTDRFVSTLAPNPGQKDRLVFDTETKGLGVRATASGSKAFLVQWTDRATGRKVREPLGLFGALTVDAARKAAQVRLGRVAAGMDPKAEREAQREAERQRREREAQAKRDAAFTLDVLVADWARLHLAGKRPRYAAEAERALRTAFAADLQKPAAALTHGRVSDVLDKLATAGRAAMAGRTMAYGRACYGWAVKRRRLADNPFAGLPAIQGANPTRDRVLSDWEVGAVWRAADMLGEPFGPLVKLLLLTAQRREEVAAMRWSELSADLSTWTLPGERAKNGKPHVVHLSKPARAILQAVKRLEGVDLVFTTTGETAPSGFSKAKAALDKTMAKDAAAMGLPHAADWRFHDFRRTAVTWMAGAGFPPHVADRLLNHVSGTISGVAAVYQRNEFLTERKAALDAWGAQVVGCGAGPQAVVVDGGKVVADLAAARRRRA
jgi:integrase